MSDISEVLAAIKRGDLVLEEISKESSGSLKTILTALGDLKGPIQDLIDFEKKQNEEVASLESTNMALSKEIMQLKEEKASTESKQKETQEQLDSTTEKRSSLESKKQDTQNEVVRTTNELSSAKNELSNAQKKVAELEKEIKELIGSSEKEIAQLEKLAEEKRDGIRRIKGEQIALQYLIKNKHIEFNELKIINSLDGRKNTDLATIVKVTGLSQSLVVKTLEGLMKRNVLTFDKDSGAITVSGNLRL